LDDAAPTIARTIDAARGTHVKRTDHGSTDSSKAEYSIEQVHELCYQALETELGGVQVYETALRCINNDGLAKEFNHYLRQTRTHVQVATDLCGKLGLDPNKDTPGRQVVRHIGESLVKAMEKALAAGKPDAAQLVACECVVLAETKDHANWELIGHVATHGKGDAKVLEALKAAHDEVEEDEDHHVYHSKGWTRELWIQSLGLPAVLPPPEEVKKVDTAIGAARAEQSREQMPKRH